MSEANHSDQHGVTVTPLHPAELDAAIGVLARGMRDNPLHVAAFGEDPARRQRGLTRIFGTAGRVLGWEHQMLTTRNNTGTIVPVSARWRCQAAVSRPCHSACG